MSRFHGIQLILEDGFSKDEAVEVTFGSRSMLNFVERRLAEEQHESDFTKLNIYCSRSPVDDNLIRYREPKGFIGIKVQMDTDDLLSSPSRFQEICADIVRKGVRSASLHVPLPQESVLKAIDDFIDGGFVNQWIHTDKSWKRVGVRSLIRCNLFIDAFVLTQSVYRDEKLLAEAMIARTKPREWLFYPLLGKLTLSTSQIVFQTSTKLVSSFDLETEKFEFPDDNIDRAFASILSSNGRTGSKTHLSY